MAAAENSDGNANDNYEELLTDVTVPLNYREVPYDPQVLESIVRDSEKRYGEVLIDESDFETERYDMLQRIRRVIGMKLTPRPAQVLRMVLASGLNFSEIGRKLGITKQGAHKNYERGVEKLRDHFSNKRYSFTRTGFPIQVKVFPLDDENEKKTFCEFINRNEIIQVSYTADSEFASAMVLYKES